MLVEVPYPGFEDRAAAATLDDFVGALSRFCRESGRPVDSAYATGIGCLFALALRARDELRLPLVFQGPVLWGLEDRWFPRVMRARMARELLTWSIRCPWFQSWLSHRLFIRQLEPSLRASFFEGYVQCRSFADMFAWLTPGWLEALRGELAARPGALDQIRVWVGGLDRVVGLREVVRTERVLGVRWPVAEFPGWGHYPMIDQPEEWAKALRDVVEAAPCVPRPNDPETP